MSAPLLVVMKAVAVVAFMGSSSVRVGRPVRPVHKINITRTAARLQQANRTVFKIFSIFL
jgi:hypothetical protein